MLFKGSESTWRGGPFPFAFFSARGDISRMRYVATRTVFNVLAFVGV
jgi:hypothetical protein